VSQTLEQAIKAGDPIPDVTVHTMGDGGPEEVHSVVVKKW